MDWIPIKKFLSQRNIVSIELKNMYKYNDTEISRADLTDSNEILLTLTKKSLVTLKDLNEKREMDLYVVLSNYMKNPNADSALFKQYIKSIKRTNKVQSILDAWSKK